MQSGVFGGASNFEPRDLVRDINYTPFGALQSETYGNELIHSMAYNERLQPTEIRLGRPDNLEAVFRIGYIYGIANNVNDPDPEITPVHNNGNVARVKYFVSGTVQYAQTFQYDPLNRIRYAVEHNNGVYSDGNRAWYQTFDYDRYGNRGINVANTSDNADATNSALQLADFSEANNRITRADYVYDAGGNLIAEPGKSYTYDGENRLVTATVGGVLANQYFYDGNGRRVKKIVGGVGTRFEYGAGGELTAERNDSGVVIKDYLYKGGELIATSKVGSSGQYEYATVDHLGTPRAWTDDSGNLIAGGRHDYLPFGEELFAGIGTRTTGQGYAASAQQDGQRKQFDEYERDDETGLDFAQARYYSSIQGRFTSPDAPFADQYEGNPQSWNLYAFVRNNPCANIDPSGRNTCYYSNGRLIGCHGDPKIKLDLNRGILTLTQEGHDPIPYPLNQVDAQFNVRPGSNPAGDFIGEMSMIAPSAANTIQNIGIGGLAIAAAPIIGPVNALLAADNLINGDTSGQPVAAGAVVISPLADDWAQKGAHVKASNGVELAVRPGMNGEIVLKPVFSSTSEAEANAAIKEVRDKINRDPAFRQKLTNTVSRGVEYLGKGSAMARSRSMELRFLLRALMRMR
jgi:RHS repeat-associated protein